MFFGSFYQFTPRRAELSSVLPVYAQAWEDGTQAQRVQQHADFVEKCIF
jgi:hypothetical protein